MSEFSTYQIMFACFWNIPYQLDRRESTRASTGMERF